MADVTPRRRRRTSPSIGDVAALARVSPQTVSRVANGSTAVLASTRDRVLAAMSELGYVPNRAARALRSGSFHTLGVISHRLSRTGEVRTVEAVVEAAREQGYTVALVDLEQPTTSELTAAAVRLEDQAIDGLIIIRAEQASPETLQLPRPLPVVVADSRFVGSLPSVGADQDGGSRAVVAHLLELGHASVLHIRGPVDSGPAEERWQATAQSLRAAGRAVPEPLIGDWTMASGYALGPQIVPRVRSGEVTAIYAANDEMAGGLYRALYETGLSVPGDVSIVGFDDIPLAAFLWPPLTTIHQDFTATGRVLVDLVLRQVREGPDRHPHRHLLPSPLVIRQSTAPPPQR